MIMQNLERDLNSDVRRWQPRTHRQENRRLVGHFYDMKNRFWAVGCGLGWAVGKKVWAYYEQFLTEVFSSFCGQKKIKTLYPLH